MGSKREFPTGTTLLDDGDVILLYSDGMIERPGRPLPASTTEVAEVAVRVLHPTVGFPLDPKQAPVQRLCSQAVELLVRATGYNDDITLLAAQRRTAPPDLHTDVRADKHAERTVRAQLREWLDTLGSDTVSGQILEHAVTEFVANTVEHAYSSTVGRVVVDGTLGGDGRARISVSDGGRWRDSTDSNDGRGRGLSIARALVPDFVVDRSDAGTTVVARHRLTRAAHIVIDHTISHAPPPASNTTFGIAIERGGTVLVVGDVDSLASPTLDDCAPCAVTGRSTDDQP